MTISSRKTSLGGSSGLDYNTTTGSFRAVASDFSIPKITTGCGTPANLSTVNNAFSLGASSGTVGMKFDPGTITNPQIMLP